MIDAAEFLRRFSDSIAPKMDAYEQVIYLFVYRHSVLEGKEKATIGFHSARFRMATGVGENGKPMAANTAHKKIKSLEQKGFLTIHGVERDGRVLSVVVPDSLDEPPETTPPMIALEDQDFFEAEENRLRILDRENMRCFYCMKEIDKATFVIEHIISRPQGDNSYRNCVAACRTCNNRKAAKPAADLLRKLFREGFLSEEEFMRRVHALDELMAGRLEPPD